MTVRVRFAPSPTGALHLGSGLTAVANREFADAHGGVLLLRLDDTDTARTETLGGEAILRDLEWLGVAVDEGPVRQSERRDAYLAAAERLRAAGALEQEAGGALRLRFEHRPTLVRGDGSPTYQLASAVDDLELGITHVLRGADLRPSTVLQAFLIEALGGTPPEYRHHGLLLGEDGQKLSKRHGAVALAELRDAGIPAEAVRAYLHELGFPRGDVHHDPSRLRRLATDAIASLPAEELAARAGAPVALVPALRGSRDLGEARRVAQSLLDPEPARLAADAGPTLDRFRELRGRVADGLDEAGARSIVRELKAVGGDLRALRLALTGRPSGPELWAVLVALPRAEALRRVDAAL